MSSTMKTNKKRPSLIMSLIKPIILISLGSSAFIWAFHNPSILNSLVYQKPGIWNLEAKINIFFTSLFLLSTLIFTKVTLAILGRVLLKNPEPIQGKDSLYVTIVNRTLANTIEFSSVFYPIFLYWLLNKASEEDAQKAHAACYLFIFARIIYTVGYLTGLVMKYSTPRGIGVGATIGLIVSVLIKSL